MAKAADTRDTLAHAALAYIDEHGTDSLSLRALAKEAGVHHTAIYRHFRTRWDLFQAIFEILVTETLARAGQLPSDPEDRLLTLIRALRATFRAHPGVTAGYLVPVPTLTDSLGVHGYQLELLSALGELGLTGHSRLVHYQILESYTLGSCVYDYGGAPEHLESRRLRHRTVADAAFEAATRSTLAIDALNEEAFDLGLVTLVQAARLAGTAERNSMSAALGS